MKPENLPLAENIHLLDLTADFGFQNKRRVHAKISAVREGKTRATGGDTNTTTAVSVSAFGLTPNCALFLKEFPNGEELSRLMTASLV